jgi:hypothetical protein
VTFCESSNNLLIFVDFLMKLEDDITYQTLKLEKKGSERNGGYRGEDKTHGAGGYRWYSGGGSEDQRHG